VKGKEEIYTLTWRIQGLHLTRSPKARQIQWGWEASMAQKKKNKALG